ncbi:hypothetical protein HPP92_000389 [Vanilla planifolia]|uniref:Peptidase A1 domain-containing protein n=1 Tax=Vanilla planifolia TaxID=51239 RepID=A0A835VFW8_VANPL|nr:hypothetical protein HPP92_000389 [Vanilla planifolia]
MVSCNIYCSSRELSNQRSKMAAFTSWPLFFLIFGLVISSSASAASTRPRALVSPIMKDSITLQYVTVVHQRTPSVPVNLVVDLGGRYLWVDCETRYTSYTYHPARCRSSLCSLAGSNSCGDCFSSPRPGCNNDTCGVFPDNPFTRTATSGELAVDVLSLPSTDGSNPSTQVTYPSFLFSCAPTFLTRGLAAGATGVAGLGRTRVAPPSQLAAKFSFRRRFALCLPSTPGNAGVLFFGPGPYRFLPNIDASQSLLYTPLLTNPVSTATTSSPGEPSYEYFIGVTAIKVGDKAVSFDKGLLKIDGKTGSGGTKISTTASFTALQTTIYRAVTGAVSTALAKVTRAASVAPFNLCYEASGFSSTRVGPGVPAIDLVLQSDQVYWRIFGANSMVEAKQGVLCLAFVDAGRNPKTSIVVGGYQLENNLLEFDLDYSRLGFSSTLLFRQTTCSNFNFTSSA